MLKPNGKRFDHDEMVQMVSTAFSQVVNDLLHEAMTSEDSEAEQLALSQARAANRAKRVIMIKLFDEAHDD